MSQHLLTRVGRERFALSLLHVVEALDAPTLHDTPRRPAGMLGTMRHRGQTISVWDGARAFGVPRMQPTGTALVLSHAGHHVAMIVDDAEDVVELLDADVRDTPVGTDGEGLLDGVVRDAHGLVSVVRMDVLVSRLLAWGGGNAE